MNPEPWQVTARNLPEHSTNPIHTDAGARAAGFERALVAGVTSYAYGLHPVLEAFGLDWVRSGSAQVRFRSPVFDGETLTVPLVRRADGGVDVSVVRDGVTRPLVDVSAWPGAAPCVEARPGEALEVMHVVLTGQYGSDYAERAGDSLDLCRRAGVVHPAVWPALANYVFGRQVVRGAWVHTRSSIVHHGLAPAGAVAEIVATVVDRFARNGERAVADVTISVDGEVVATLEHEAIIDASTIG